MSTANKYWLQPELPDSAASIRDKFYDELQLNNCSLTIQHLINSILSSGEMNDLPLEDKVQTQLFFEILLDLLKQGWSLEYLNNSFYAIPPDARKGNGTDHSEIKRRIRSGLVEARNEQLREESIKKFILEMERPRLHKGKQISVLDLFLKPQEFYFDLKRRIEAPHEIRDQLLKESIDPYIQLVSEARDEFTNLRLSDIWRYSRYTWSLPLSSQPGRQSLYLIRDAARKNHPIVGIGALGSSVVQISCRDKEIGWTLNSLEECENIGERLHALEKAINRGIEDVYHDDMLTPEEILKPCENVLSKLNSFVSNEIPSISRTTGKINSDDYLTDTLSPFYQKKRATELHQLLFAKKVFQSVYNETDGQVERYNLLKQSEEGLKALGIALRAIKKEHIGCSIMDITTCGAIPPYSDVIGGKLVSLLMTSPKVIIDYFNKYKNAKSEIASRMKGRAVVRPAHLVMLGTTSLYYTGSSQYNRIRMPVSKGGAIHYKHVGNTRGFGSVHLSNKTYRTLQEMLRVHPDLRPENSTFAAGVNFKMRSIAQGLGHLGLRKLQQHENPRLVYIVPLAKNWREYLTGLDSEPDYLFNMDDADNETEKIVEYWKERWYLKRIKKEEVLYRLKNQQFCLKLSQYIDSGDRGISNAAQSQKEVYEQLEFFGGGNMPNQPLIRWKTLGELKEDRASFAERLTDDELKVLHIPTKLDQDLMSYLDNGYRLYLVGNPGDGKTHIIKKHEVELETKGIYFHPDASAINEEDLLNKLKLAIDNDAPAVIAINEGPLRRLLPKLPYVEQTSLRGQLEKPFIYNDTGEALSNSKVLVINLGIRQVLSSNIIRGILNVVLNRVDYDQAPEVISNNRSSLLRPRVQERLIGLLEIVARSGVHITMHELLGFFSFIITSGVSDSSRTDEIMPYYDAVFSEKNPLFNHLKDFDPVNISHPLADMWLYDHELNKFEWLEPVENAAEIGFNALKRKFFFETREGNDLYDLIPDDRKTFYDLLNNSISARQSAKKKVLESLATFFGEIQEEENKLRVWTTLKYEAKKESTVFISSESVSEDRINLYVPKLREEISNLIEYEPSHLRLVVRTSNSNQLEVGMDINLELWLALMKIKRGMPNRYQDPLITRKLTNFMSRLSAQSSDLVNRLVNLYIRDTKEGRSVSIDVSYEQSEKGKYLL